MGFFKGVADKIRGFFDRDKERAVLALAKGATSDRLPTQQRDILLGFTEQGYLLDWLTVDRGLEARNADYEEMDDYPEIATAIDIFADDATQPDTQLNRTIWVTSEDKRTEQILDKELLQKRLRIDEEIWEIARTLVKYGQDYEEIIVGPDGVVGLNFLPTPTVRRIEDKDGNLLGFVQDFRQRFKVSKTQFFALLQKRVEGKDSKSGEINDPNDPAYGIVALEDWEVVHFRLRSKYRRSVYGYSVLEPARWIWKRLTLLEDMAILFRLTKAVERYAFYIDVGDMPPAEALAYVNRVRQQYRKKKYVNPTTGKLELKLDPISQDEDFFVPSRNGQEGTRIDVLGAPQWQSMDDIEYFRDKLFSSIKIPKAYMGQDEGTGRATLSSEDVRFARTVLRIQRELKNGINKICRVHLMAKNIDPSDVEYELHMTVPSAIFELAQLEVRNARADLAARMQDFVSLHWILVNIFELSEEDIKVIMRERSDDAIRSAVAAGKGEAEVQRMLNAVNPDMPEVPDAYQEPAVPDVRDYPKQDDVDRPGWPWRSTQSAQKGGQPETRGDDRRAGDARPGAAHSRLDLRPRRSGSPGVDQGTSVGLVRRRPGIGKRPVMEHCDGNVGSRPIYPLAA